MIPCNPYIEKNTYHARIFYEYIFVSLRSFMQSFYF